MTLAAFHKARSEYVKFIKWVTVRTRGCHHCWRPHGTESKSPQLFSFEWKRTAKAIDRVIQIAAMQPERVFVGGIVASLMHDDYQNEARWAGVRFIKGFLVGTPAEALKLSAEDCDFGADDLSRRPIEERTPDYGILSDINNTYPVRDAYFGYALRGCVRNTHFAVYPSSKGPQREMPPLTELVNGIDSAHRAKKVMYLTNSQHSLECLIIIPSQF